MPIAILTAAAFESIISKWHSLFPENPYAHVFGAFPIAIVTCIIVYSGLTHFIFGYHYTPIITQNFNDDIVLINEHLHNDDILVVDTETEQRDFYQLLSEYSDFTVREDVPDTSDKRIVLLGKTTKTADMQLKQIITSRKARNSDRLYIYEKVTEQQSGEENGSDNGSDEANQ